MLQALTGQTFYQHVLLRDHVFFSYSFLASIRFHSLLFMGNKTSFFSVSLLSACSELDGNIRTFGFVPKTSAYMYDPEWHDLCKKRSDGTVRNIHKDTDDCVCSWDVESCRIDEQHSQFTSCHPMSFDFYVNWPCGCWSSIWATLSTRSLFT